MSKKKKDPLKGFAKYLKGIETKAARKAVAKIEQRIWEAFDLKKIDRATARAALVLVFPEIQWDMLPCAEEPPPSGKPVVDDAPPPGFRPTILVPETQPVKAFVPPPSPHVPPEVQSLIERTRLGVSSPPVNPWG